MIYLDYSATTPVNETVLEAFNECNRKYYGNPNSNHELGLLANHQIQKATKEIQDILKAEAYEVIYTSGATESNNLAIIGYALANQHKGKHIISTPYEHSSVASCLNYLDKLGFEIDILNTSNSGFVNPKELNDLIRTDTLLVSIAKVNSELGIKQDFTKIKEVLKEHPHVVFHSDMTQAIGKLKVDLTGIDLISLSAHKFYGLKGIGALLRKKSIHLVPVVHGGKSTSIFRGGTPPAPLIASLSVALRLAYQDFDKRLEHIQGLYEFLKEELKQTIKRCEINYDKGIPQILNVSFLDIEAHKLHKELSKRQIYISTQTACSSEAAYSHMVKEMTGSDRRAETSVRISLSHLTKKKELVVLIDTIKEIIDANR